MRRSSLLLLAFLLCLCASAQAVISQGEGVRVAVEAKLSPRSLPRVGAAPISVSVSGKVSATEEGATPPQLRRLSIEINKQGRFETKGLATCNRSQIQPATDARALAACRPALVGHGSFDAYIYLSGASPYPAHGHLLLFNARPKGVPLLYGHIYISKPVASSFIINFEISHSSKGRFGTVLSANLARDLGSRRSLTGIDLTLSRRYAYAGRRRSFLSAGCPAPKGISKMVPFPLVRTNFAFAGGANVSQTLIETCKARG